MKNHNCLVLLIFIFVLFVGQNVNAQEQKTQEKPAEPKELIYEYEGEKYYPATYKNLSDIYWYFGLPSPDSIQDVEMYFRINECELYQKYQYNEFDWEPIVEAMKGHLSTARKTFNTRMYYVVPIELGDYDFSGTLFPVVDDALSDGIHKFRPDNDKRLWPNYICESGFYPDSYPQDIIVQFRRPLYISKISASRVQGRKMVARWQKLQEKNRLYKSYVAPRNVYARVYINFERYVPKNTNNAAFLPTFVANVEGYEVFDDRDFTVKLDEKSLKKKKRN